MNARRILYCAHDVQRLRKLPRGITKRRCSEGGEHLISGDRIRICCQKCDMRFGRVWAAPARPRRDFLTRAKTINFMCKISRRRVHAGVDIFSEDAHSRLHVIGKATCTSSKPDNTFMMLSSYEYWQR